MLSDLCKHVLANMGTPQVHHPTFIIHIRTTETKPNSNPNTNFNRNPNYPTKTYHLRL